jgi:hypothetical protein
LIYICALVGWNKTICGLYKLFCGGPFWYPDYTNLDTLPTIRFLRRFWRVYPEISRLFFFFFSFFCQYVPARQSGCWHNCRVSWFTRQQTIWRTLGGNLSFVLFVSPEIRGYLQRTIFKLWNHAWNYGTLPLATQEVGSREGTTNWSHSFDTQMFVAWRTGTRLINLGCNSSRFRGRVCRSNYVSLYLVSRI